MGNPHEVCSHTEPMCRNRPDPVLSRAGKRGGSSPPGTGVPPDADAVPGKPPHCSLLIRNATFSANRLTVFIPSSSFKASPGVLPKTMFQ